MLSSSKFPAQCFITLLFAFCAASLSAANWQPTLSKDSAGNFPELRPLRASYRFGWSGLTAATGEVHFTKPSRDKFQFDGTGRTIGLARALWRMDVNYRATAGAETLHPTETQQTESYRWKKIVTHLAFTSSAVTRTSTEAQGGTAETKTRPYSLPAVFDLPSAALYSRTHSPRIGSFGHGCPCFGGGWKTGPRAPGNSWSAASVSKSSRPVTGSRVRA